MAEAGPRRAESRAVARASPAANRNTIRNPIACAARQAENQSRPGQRRVTCRRLVPEAAIWAVRWVRISPLLDGTGTSLIVKKLSRRLPLSGDRVTILPNLADGLDYPFPWRAGFSRKGSDPAKLCIESWG